MNSRKVVGCESARVKLLALRGYCLGTSCLACLLGAVITVLSAAQGLPTERINSRTNLSVERVQPALHKKKTTSAAHQKETDHSKPVELHEAIQRLAAPEPPTSLLPELATAKQAIELVRQGRAKDTTALVASIDDPLATKLVEWALLRRSDSVASFDRYLAFISANPDWPSMPLIRRRAEAKLWNEQRDSATVRHFVGDEPSSAMGRLALARAEIEDGDRNKAARAIRAVWQSAQLSAEQEIAVLAAFPDVLTRADHAARMDRRIGAKDFGAAMRAAKRTGDDQVAIVKACVAAEARSGNGGALLDAVRAEARADLGYALCRLHWLLRNESPGSNFRGRIVTSKEDIAAAVKLALSAPLADLRRQDADEWWRERRILARKLIDLGDARTAYQVVRNAAPPANPYYRADLHFMAGWIALRFLADATTALEDFAQVDDGATDPIVRARAAYWRGRAAEALGQFEEMRAQYSAAARYSTAYYGQLARARLGLDEIVELRSPPDPADENSNELLRAVHILYKIGERDLALSFISDLAQESNSASLIAGIGSLTERYNDAHAMLLVGKTALTRGMQMDVYAFPDIGVPDFRPMGSGVDRCIIYSIVRTESGFEQRDKSSANAVGLMQVTPGAGRDTARHFAVAYDWRRLVSDPTYNTQIGAGEVSLLLKDYGSFIMTFAGYNAGRGRVAQWVARHGDPRDPKVDPVDWVERIPFAETRNYVERVAENQQVYCKRVGNLAATPESNPYQAARVKSH